MKPIDARREILTDHLELYNTFVQSLFTVLYEVYNSSAGPAVKHRCLQSLLRMIYYSPSSLLETILKQQSISSHIASMLASSDYKIVISALQISEILMKKLPTIFSVYFYREGVVHQIEILIGFGIASSSHVSITRSQPTTMINQSSLDSLNTTDNPTTPILNESSGKSLTTYN
jgi:E3 ubiquitin-protein ligase TRIP12